MRTLATFGLALGALWGFAFPAVAQYQNPEWIELAPAGDSFRVSMPNQPRLELEKIGTVSGNRYVALTGVATYTVWSVTSANYRSGEDTDQYLDSTAELVWEGLLKPAREKLDEEERSKDERARRHATMSYVKELPPSGLPGREYTLTIGDVTGTTQFFLAHEHIYILLAMGQPGGDWPREKFFASFRSSLSSAAPTPEPTPEVGAGTMLANGGSTAVSRVGEPEDYNRVFSGREVTQKVRVLEKPEPTYTESARKFSVTGTTVLRAIFSKDGEVTNLHVLAKLPHGLTQRAIDAARQIRFTPATKDGHPVSMWIELQYNFNLY